jgi:hypothetical protein
MNEDSCFLRRNYIAGRIINHCLAPKTKEQVEEAKKKEAPRQENREKRREQRRQSESGNTTGLVKMGQGSGVEKETKDGDMESKIHTSKTTEDAEDPKKDQNKTKESSNNSTDIGNASSDTSNKRKASNEDFAIIRQKRVPLGLGGAALLHERPRDRVLPR